MTRRLLALTGGHSFDREAFGAFLDARQHWTVTWVDQPDGDRTIRFGEARDFDAVLAYDMPGISVALGQPTRNHEADAELRAGWRSLVDGGTGIVFLHHALAGWPTWPDYAEMLGGAFLYEPRTVRGRDLPDSGYREDVPQTFRVVAEHPVTEGIPATFGLPSDEPYLCPVFEDTIEVLIRRADPIEPGDFLSSDVMVATGREQRCSPDGHAVSDAVAWVRPGFRSRIVYLQPGDNGETFTDPVYSRLVDNALRWVSSQSDDRAETSATPTTT